MTSKLVKALLAAPPAFALGCAALSHLASDSSARLSPLLAGISAPSSSDTTLAVAAAELVFRALALDAASADADSGSSAPSSRLLCEMLSLHSECSPAAAEAVAGEAVRRGLISGGSRNSSATAAAAAAAPDLEALSWSLNVATRATTAASLQQPFVTLDLRLRAPPPLLPGASASGAEPNVWHERMELTLGQLSVVEASLREALAALDRA